MIFLRDLHFGFLPDDCEQEFKDCFKKIADDAQFAARCFKVSSVGKLKMKTKKAELVFSSLHC